MEILICRSLINSTNCEKFGLNPEGKYNVAEDYIKFLTVVNKSKHKYGLRKYIAQLTKQENDNRKHPTHKLKAEYVLKWWQEIGMTFILNVNLIIKYCLFLQQNY